MFWLSQLYTVVGMRVCLMVVMALVEENTTATFAGCHHASELH